jgi:protein-tyrosine-phosphatase
MHGSLSSARAPNLFKALAHDLRWQILMLLVRSDYCGQELVQLLNHPQNSLSYHLTMLRELEVITERRSAADERFIYYSLNLGVFRALYSSSAEALSPILEAGGPIAQSVVFSSSGKAIRVLFLCTHNSVRSQMAEGILRTLSEGQIETWSAGSQPIAVHPWTMQILRSYGIDISEQQSKHLNALKQHSFEYVITVCDRVREFCPPFPGNPERIHWSIADPLAVQGSEQERYQACEHVAVELMMRIRSLMVLIGHDQQERANIVCPHA